MTHKSKYISKFICLCAFVLFCGANLNAKNTNSLKNLKTFEADFKQVVSKDDSNDNVKIKYLGKIYIDGSRVCWHYKKPFVKYLYIKKNKVTTIEPLLKQAIITKLDEQFDMLKILQKAKQISHTKSSQVFTTRLNGILYKITIKHNLIYKIEYNNELQNRVTITFSNQSQNKKIPSNIFTIKLPDDYDVLIR